MENKNRRQFSRVPIQWAAQLDFGAREYKHFVDNVSLGGIYVKGRFDQVISDVCVIKLKQSSLYSSIVVNAVGSIARINDDGIALQFVSMKLDSFFFLQTSLMYKAVNPMAIGREFIKNNIFEIDNDLVLYQTAKAKEQQGFIDFPPPPEQL